MKWETPALTATKYPRDAYVDELAELRDNPGKWGVVDEFPLSKEARARTTAHEISTGRYRAARPPGTFQGASRKLKEEGVVRIYARYVGDHSTSHG